MTYDPTITTELAKGLIYTGMALAFGFGLGTLFLALLPKGDEP